MLIGHRSLAGERPRIGKPVATVAVMSDLVIPNLRPNDHFEEIQVRCIFVSVLPRINLLRHLGDGSFHSPPHTPIHRQAVIDVVAHNVHGVFGLDPILHRQSVTCIHAGVGVPDQVPVHGGVVGHQKPPEHPGHVALVRRYGGYLCTLLFQRIQHLRGHIQAHIEATYPAGEVNFRSLYIPQCSCCIFGILAVQTKRNDSFLATGRKQIDLLDILSILFQCFIFFLGFFLYRHSNQSGIHKLELHSGIVLPSSWFGAIHSIRMPSHREVRIGHYINKCHTLPIQYVTFVLH
mmetsp:Transcript_22370/g.37414  ORF Transcript_22370/g.37414 Transcript_22370/m.37414 type:complete len:291 (+) Transcript_22370:299-1171(+)